MSLFGNLKSDGLEESEDRLGGYKPFETDIYPTKIKMAYAGKSAGGATSITLIADVGGKDYRETIYVTTKAGVNYYPSKDREGKPTNKKSPLPGFTVVDDLCLVATGKGLSEQDVEEKIVKIYDPELRKEVNKAMPVLFELLGQEVGLGIVASLENKTVKNSSTGLYEPVAEERTVNHIDKVYDLESKRTVSEARGGKTTGEFWDAWAEKNRGVTRDKREIKDGAGGVAGRPGAARAPSGPPMAANAGGQAAPRKSLFSKAS